tara:strand:- start:806 stop:1291 length:486 start_codon:yes stop_codon:yes gene_type:complete
MQGNGRINVLDNNMNNVFSLYDKIPVNDKMGYRDAMKGNWIRSRLSNLYFSAENIQIIQNAIRAGVYKKSNNQYIIAPQNEDTLKIIMRSIFLQNSSNMLNNITAQIIDLNDIVVNYCVPKLLGEAKGYIKYKEDISNLAVPINRPISTYNSKTLERKKFI